MRRVLIGYARVSTAEQNPAHQVDALTRAGVAGTDIYLDHASGAKASRPQLDLVLRLLRPGDTLLVTATTVTPSSTWSTSAPTCVSAAWACRSSSRASTPPPRRAGRCSGCCPSSPSCNAN